MEKMNSDSLTPTGNNPRRLEGKVVIVTGGASGIGASATRLFWQNGAKVVVADIQDELGQALCNELDQNVHYIHCDVSNEDDVRDLINNTIAKHGKLDVMYNNAGILGRPVGSIIDADKSELDRLMAVNVGGAFLGAKHAARVMVPERKGCILFTASACACIAGLATSSYTASKYAIVGLAKALAAELGQYGIRVNCISPYAVMTGIDEFSQQEEALMSKIGNLQGMVLKADDVARAALYLASDEANYVSGLNLVVDGGFSVVNPSLMMALNAWT